MNGRIHRAPTIEGLLKDLLLSVNTENPINTKIISNK